MRFNYFNVIGSTVVNGAKTVPSGVKVVASKTVDGVKATPGAVVAVGSKVVSAKNLRITTKDQLPRNRRVNKSAKKA
jgi:hypothetical protein